MSKLFQIWYEGSDYSDPTYSDPMSEEEVDKQISFIDELNAKELASISYRKISYDPSVLSEGSILSAIRSQGELSKDVVKQAFNHRKAFKFAKAILDRDDAKDWYYDIFDKLGHNNGMMMELALKPDTPDFILWKLVLQGYDMVRHQVAKKPDLPLGLIEMLSKDSEERVRIVIAGRRDVPDWILEVLYNDSSDKVRRIVESKKGFETVHLRVRKSVGLTQQDMGLLGVAGGVISGQVGEEATEYKYLPDLGG